MLRQFVGADSSLSKVVCPEHLLQRPFMLVPRLVVLFKQAAPWLTCFSRALPRVLSVTLQLCSTPACIVKNSVLEACVTRLAKYDLMWTLVFNRVGFISISSS